MKLSSLERECELRGFTLLERSEYHYQIVMSPSGREVVVLVDVWPASNKFAQHKAKPGTRASVGNEQMAVELAAKLSDRKAQPFAFKEDGTQYPPAKRNGDGGLPVTATFNIPADPLNHPAHYTAGKIEVIDVIEGLGLDKDFLLGNVIKYVARSEFKGRQLEDLKKAEWYLRRKIANLESAATE